MIRKFFIFTALIALFTWGSIYLIPYTAFYPKVFVQADRGNALEFFVKGQTDRSACEAIRDKMKSSILHKCPSCKLQAVCTMGPDGSHRQALSSFPLRDVSFRYGVGVVVIRSPNKSMELAICNVLKNGIKGTCFPPGVRRHS